MATLATLIVKIASDTSDLEKGLANAQKQAEGWGGKFTKGLQGAGKLAIGGAVAGLAVGVAAVGKVMSSAIPLAADFQSQLANLEIAASGSSLSFDELHDAALKVGGDTKLVGVSATGAADAMTGLFKAGLSSTEIFGDLQGYMSGTAELGGALRASIDLAAATTLDMVQASDLATVALSTFGGELETESERADFINSAMNNLVQAADASVAEVGDLAAALKNVGPTAAALGIGIEDTNNALAILSTRGIKGSEAGTALKSMLANLQRPTDAVTAQLEALNVTLYDSQGVFVGMPNLIGQLQLAMSGMTQEQKNLAVQTLAGTYGMNAMNTLLAEGTDGWYAMAEATENAAGIQEQAAAKADTFNGRMEALQGALETLKIGIGEAFLPMLQRLVEWLGKMAEQYGPIVVKAVEKMATAIGNFIDEVMNGEGPMAALMNLLREFDVAEDVRIKIYNLVNSIQDFIKEVQRVMKPVLEWIAANTELRDWLTALAVVIGVTLIGAMLPLIVTMGQIVLAVGVLVAAVTVMRRAWAEDWGGMRTFILAWVEQVSAGWQSMKEWWETLMVTIDQLKVIMTFALEAGKQAWESFSATVGGVIDRISRKIQSVIQWVQRFIDKLKDIKLPDILTPGSPTPFELGLRGIADALAVVNSELGISQRALGGIAPLGMTAGNGGGGNTTTINQTWNITPTMLNLSGEQRARMQYATGGI